MKKLITIILVLASFWGLAQNVVIDLSNPSYVYDRSKNIYLFDTINMIHSGDTIIIIPNNNDTSTFTTTANAFKIYGLIVTSSVTSIDTLDADTISALKIYVVTLTVDTAHIDDLDVDTITADSLYSKIADIDTLKTDTATFDKLFALTITADSIYAKIIKNDTLINDTILSLITYVLSLTVDSLYITDTDLSNKLWFKWNENDNGNRTLNILVSSGDRTFTLSGNLTVESASIVNQDLTTDADVIHKTIEVDTAFADVYTNKSDMILSESGSNITINADTTKVVNDIDATGWINADKHYEISGDTILAVKTSNLNVGIHTGMNITSGVENTFVGYQAGFTDTSGLDNTGIGSMALYWNTSGSYNTAAGREAMLYNTTGEHNAAFGGHALKDNTSGKFNAACGVNSLYKNTIASCNSALGTGALFTNTVGTFNTAAGYRALYFANGNSNIAIGYRSLYYGSAIIGNVCIGSNANAKSTATTGNYNVYIGDSAGYSNTGSYNIFIGRSSGKSEIVSNKLYIENSNTSTPLIWGDFATDSLIINGILNVTGKSYFGDNMRLTGDLFIAGGNDFWITDASGVDSARIRDDGDTTRFESDNPIKILEGSLIVSADSLTSDKKININTPTAEALVLGNGSTGVNYYMSFIGNAEIGTILWDYDFPPDGRFEVGCYGMLIDNIDITEHLHTDTILETTEGQGVCIDGVIIKDSSITTKSISGNSGINFNDKLITSQEFIYQIDASDNITGDVITANEVNPTVVNVDFHISLSKVLSKIFGATVVIDSIKVYIKTNIDAAYVTNILLQTDDHDGTGTTRVTYATDIGNGDQILNFVNILPADYTMLHSQHYWLLIDVTDMVATTDIDFRGAFAYCHLE